MCEPTLMEVKSDVIRFKNFGMMEVDDAEAAKPGEQALEMSSRICDPAEEPEIGAERKERGSGPAR